MITMKVKKMTAKQRTDHVESLRQINLGKYSIAELAEMIVHEKNDDDALSFEYEIQKRIDNTNVREIAPLFLSEDQDSNVAALRCLSDGRVKDLTDIYQCVDLLFERDDLILKRLSTSLIQQHDYYQSAANNRMAQFIDSKDEPLRRNVWNWLIWRSVEELQDFAESYKITNSQAKYLIEQIILFKSKKTPLDQFLENVEAVDEVPFREYKRLAGYKWGATRALFHDD